MEKGKKDCIIVAIVTAVVFLSGIAGYMYMKECKENCGLENNKINQNQNSQLSEDELLKQKIKKQKEAQMDTGSKELNDIVKKIERFSIWSPRTIPEIVGALKKIYKILQKFKLAKADNDIDFYREASIAEGEHQFMLNKISVLGLDIPDEPETKKIFEANTRKLDLISNKYLEEIKKIAAENNK